MRTPPRSILSLLVLLPAAVALSAEPCALSRRRRDLIRAAGRVPVALVLAGMDAAAVAALTAPPRVSGPGDGNLPDLPPEAVRSYLQYRIPLQTAADFYVFELQELLRDPSDYGTVAELFQASRNNGQGNPSRMEREFTNPFRILGLSMPPEYADDLRDAQYRFEAAAQRLSRATAGLRRDLPVAVDAGTVEAAAAAWEDGRSAINDAFGLLNAATGLGELRPVPPAGPDQLQRYGRSERRYLELKKKLKLCQNRGGPSLSQGWGKLMVAGYLQDSCGIPDLNEYFYQCNGAGALEAAAIVTCRRSNRKQWTFCNVSSVEWI